MHNLDKLHILVVEHNDDDIKILKRIVTECKVNCELHFARDGEEALDALAQTANFGTMPSPDLILINLNLPKINGWDVLSKAKEDVRARRIPVIVLTKSEREEDMVKAYDCGAASYLLTPVDPERFVELTETVSEYWQLVRQHPD